MGLSFQYNMVNIKKLDGMFVAIDDLNNIIGFDMDVDRVKEYVNWYQDNLSKENKRIIRIVDPETRIELKKLL